MANWTQSSMLLLNINKMKSKLLIYIILVFVLINSPVSAQNNSLVQSGPMLGYSEMLESLIWVQTTTEASV